MRDSTLASLGTMYWLRLDRISMDQNKAIFPYYCAKSGSMSQALWARMATLVFELEKKNGTQRQTDRMKSGLEEAGILLLNPLGEAYQDTRPDREASIMNGASGPLFVVAVIKPVIYGQQNGQRTLLQRGVVIVGSKA